MNKEYDPEKEVNSHTDGEYLPDYSDFKPSKKTEQPASEDELWEEIEKEIINWENEDEASLADFIDFLKSKFEIRRKQ